MIRVMVAVLTTLLVVSAVGASEPSDLLERTLGQLEKSRSGLKTISAGLRYEVKQLIKEDPDDEDEFIEYNGQLKLILDEKDPVSMVYFSEFISGKRIFRQRSWYIVRGAWLIEAKEKTESVIKRQLVKEGQRVELFKLGEGPLPIPFGQTAAEMRAEFNMQASQLNPETVRLRCVPKSASALAKQFAFVQIDIVCNASSPLVGLPVKLVAEDLKNVTLNTVEFQMIKRNPALKPSELNLPTETAEWDHSAVPLN